MFPIDGETQILDLTLNKQLIPKGYFTKTQTRSNKHKVTIPHRNDVELCHYGGKIRNKPNSWVAISTCDGLSGVIFDGHDMHYIEKHKETHFLYKHSDLAQHNKTCGYAGDAKDPHQIYNNNRILRVFFWIYTVNRFNETNISV